jgi:hypothetical protein
MFMMMMMRLGPSGETETKQKLRVVNPLILDINFLL